MKYFKYPTIEQVEAADRDQLGKWFRFLPSAGSEWCGLANFSEKFKEERMIMQRIIERFDDLGGMDSVLSKKIGWI